MPARLVLDWSCFWVSTNFSRKFLSTSNEEGAGEWAILEALENGSGWESTDCQDEAEGSSKTEILRSAALDELGLCVKGPTMDALDPRLEPEGSPPAADVGLFIMDFRGLAMSDSVAVWLLFFLVMDGRALPRDAVVMLERLRGASLPLVVLVSGGFVDVCDRARLEREEPSVLSM